MQLTSSESISPASEALEGAAWLDLAIFIHDLGVPSQLKENVVIFVT
jgi:hypothetical protein